MNPSKWSLTIQVGSSTVRKASERGACESTRAPPAGNDLRSSWGIPGSAKNRSEELGQPLSNTATTSGGLTIWDFFSWSKKLKAKRDRKNL